MNKFFRNILLNCSLVKGQEIQVGQKCALGNELGLFVLLSKGDEGKGCYRKVILSVMGVFIVRMVFSVVIRTLLEDRVNRFFKFSKTRNKNNKITLNIQIDFCRELSKRSSLSILFPETNDIFVTFTV